MMKKYDLTVSIMWGVNLLVIAIMVIFPQIEEWFEKIYYLFLICLFLVPLLSNLLLAYDMILFENYNDVALCMPASAGSLTMIFIFVKFVVTISREVVPQFIVILLTFVLFEFVVCLFAKGVNNKRKYLVSCLLMYFGIVVFFLCAMVLSYDHNILW